MTHFNRFKKSLYLPLIFFIFSLFWLQPSIIAGQNRPKGVDEKAAFDAKNRIWILTSNSKESVWYENGNYKAAGGMVAGKKSGLWKYYYPSGTLKAEGNFHSDKMEGEWKLYHANGNIGSSGLYKNGARAGRWIFKYPSGSKESEGDYHAGLKEGVWINYYENGKIFYQGNYQTGLAQGEWSYYFNNGTLHQKGNYREDRKIGSWYICIFATGPCSTERFDNPKSPEFSNLPPPGMQTGSSIKDTKDPSKLLDSLEKSDVPDEVPPSLRQSQWD